MSEHATAIIMDGQTVTAFCICGWKSEPTYNDLKARRDGREHERARRRVRPEAGGEEADDE